MMLMPCIILALVAQGMVKKRYTAYSRIPISRGMTGWEIADYILRYSGINDVSVEMIEGELTDHYDPVKKALRLSRNIYYGNSIAAAGIAAHEAGHAIQHHQAYLPLSFRNAFFPVANLGSKLAFPLIFLGLILNFMMLFKLAIILFSCAVLFSIITLPVEFNASSRAVKALSNYNLLTVDEQGGVRKVLDAAAMTYVAATLTAIMQLVYYLMVSRNRD